MANILSTITVKAIQSLAIAGIATTALVGCSGLDMNGEPTTAPIIQQDESSGTPDKTIQPITGSHGVQQAESAAWAVWDDQWEEYMPESIIEQGFRAEFMGEFDGVPTDQYEDIILVLPTDDTTGFYWFNVELTQNQHNELQHVER